MTMKLKSILTGAACAAFLILPTLSGLSQVQAGPPGAPPAPPAPSAPPSWQHPGSGNWTSWPARNYDARSVKLQDIVGTIVVNVRDGGPMTVEAWGARDRLHGLTVGVHDGRLDVEASGFNDNQSVWDWRHWFDFSHMNESSPHDLTVRVTVPRGTDVDVDSLVGDATIGDTQGNLRLEAAATKARIGRVASANIDIGGSGRIDIASVSGTLKLDVGGSGKIMTGPIGSLRADLAGSGDAQFGPINGGMDLDIAGAADVTAARVNGPTKVSIAGSGSVKIADGTADPLHVEIMGSGNFAFGGVAVDPHVEAFGSGNVRIKSYRGKLDTEGMADVKIGD
jgi:hypothetical protein